MKYLAFGAAVAAAAILFLSRQMLPREVDVQEITSDVTSTFYSPSVIARWTGQKLSEDAVPVWDDVVKVAVVRRSARPFLEGRLLADQLARYGQVVPNTRFEIAPEGPNLLIVAHDTLLSAPSDQRIGLLREMNFVGEWIAKMARDLEGFRDCAIHLGMAPDGGIEQAIIFVDTSERSPKFHDAEQCLYHGLVWISGFPRTQTILTKYGDRVRELDRIALAAIYACRGEGEARRLMVSKTCVNGRVPPETTLKLGRPLVTPAPRVRAVYP